MSIYKNISRAEYIALPGINASTLKYYFKSIKHGNFKKNERKPPTAAMMFGTMVHKYILEHEDFYNEYALLEGEPVNPKTEKPYGTDSKKYEEFLATLDQSKEYIPSEDMKRLEVIRKNIVNHNKAMLILDNAENRETAVTWTDEVTGVECKALIDYWGKVGGDLKTIAEIKSKAQLSSKVIDMGYDIQFSMYNDGLEANGVDIPFTVIFAETGNECDVAPFDMSDELLEYGRVRYRKCIENWLNREEDTGAFEDIEELELPGWAKF